MVRKRIYDIFAAALCVFLLFSFIGCNEISQNEDELSLKKCRITLAVSDMGRTILPTNITENDIAKAELLFRKSGIGDYSPLKAWTATQDSENALTVMFNDKEIEIEAGTFDFKLNLYVISETDSNSSAYRLIQSGIISSKEIVAGENQLVFEANYVESGDLSLTLKWIPSSDQENQIGKIEALLYEISSSGAVGEKVDSLVESTTPEACTDENESKFYSTQITSTEVPNGSYYIKFVLYDTDLKTVINVILDLVKIHGYKTEKTILLDLEKLNVQYSITYNLNGGKWADGVEETLTTKRNAYTSVFLPTAGKLTNEDGSQFCGWYVDENCTEYIKEIGIGSEYAKNYTLYALWAAGMSASDAVSAIKGMTESGTVKVAGVLTEYNFKRICAAIHTHDENDVLVDLDISATRGLENIWYAADEPLFYQSPALSGLHIPASVTYIDGVLFCGCSSLATITVDSASETYKAEDNILYSKDGKTLVLCSREKTEVEVPNTVTKIGYYAFDSCSVLTKILLPDSVTNIEGTAFGNCASLASITIPDKVTFIGSCAFMNCTSLTSITIPGMVTGLESSIFSNCTSLAMVRLSVGLEEIAVNAFMDCSSLKSVDIPEGVKTISGFAFWGSGIEEITIPASLTKIEDSFYAVDSLAKITVDAANIHFKSVDDVLFDYDGTTILCYPPKKQGTSYEIPAGVTKIGDNAFGTCELLEKIVIPDTVTYIGEGAFHNDYHLTELSIPDGVTHIGASAFDSLQIETLKLPPKITSIEHWAFYFSGISYITIPDGVTDIKYEAFWGCGNLKTVTLPASLKTIEHGAFSPTSLSTIYFNGTEEQWDAISVDSKDNAPLLNAQVVFVDTVHTLYVSGTGNDTTYTVNGAEIEPDGTIENPFESIDKACEKIIEAEDADDWTIFIMGDVTGPHEGTNKAGSRANANDYGMSSIPATITSAHAKSILVTGYNGLDENGLHQDVIDCGATQGDDGYTTLTILTEVPVTITNLKITNGGTNLVVGGEYDNSLVNADVTLGEGVLITGTVSDSDGYPNGHGVLVESGTLTLDGGSITGNDGNGGGGVKIEGGEFIMKNGIISANSSVSYGGGVYIEEGATFTMTGGIIGGSESTDANTAGNDDGSGYGTGVYVSAGSTFRMGGDAVITSNNDVTLANGSVITICKSFEGTDIKATITPETYENGTVVLVSDGVDLEYEYDYFAVTDNAGASWNVKLDGTIEESE